MQIVVLGDGNCGKTSLIRGLIGLRFDPASPATTRRSSFSSTIKQEEVVFIDCGPIVDEFDLKKLLNNASIVLISYDCSNRSSFEDIQALWYDAVVSCLSNKEALIILVGCKMDLTEERYLKEEVEQFAENRQICAIEVSARVGSNMKLLLDIIRMQIPKRKAEVGTTLRISRSGSVDMNSSRNGIQFHVSSDGVISSTNRKNLLLKDENERNSEISSTKSSSFPLMVDVKMSGGTGEIGTIIIETPEDDPLLLAKRFVRQYHLDPNGATELARIVENRLSEYFSPNNHSLIHHPSTRQRKDSNTTTTTTTIPVTSTVIKTGSSSILARLNVETSSGIPAVVAVREGDQPRKLVEAFRKTYSLSASDPLLVDLSKKISQVLNIQEDDENHAWNYQLENQQQHQEEISPKKQQRIPPPTKLSLQPPPSIIEQENKQEEDDDEEEEVPYPEEEEVEEVYVEEEEEEVPQPAAVPPPPPSRYGKPSPIRNPPTIASSSSSSPKVNPRTTSNSKLAPRTTTTTPTRATRSIQQQPPPRRQQVSSPLIKNASPVVQQRVQQQFRATTTPSSSSSPSTRGGNNNNNNRPYFTISRGGTRPLFLVDVNMDGKSDRIGICKGDNLTEVAEKFLEANHLPKTKTMKLTQLLEYNMKLHQQARKKG